jgi:hypothetical protein
MLGPEDARSDNPLQFVDLDLHVLRLLDRLGVEIVGSGQEIVRANPQ